MYDTIIIAHQRQQYDTMIRHNGSIVNVAYSTSQLMPHFYFLVMALSFVLTPRVNRLLRRVVNANAKNILAGATQINKTNPTSQTIPFPNSKQTNKKVTKRMAMFLKFTRAVQMCAKLMAHRKQKSKRGMFCKQRKRKGNSLKRQERTRKRKRERER